MMIVPKQPSYTLQDFIARLFTSFSLLIEHTYQQVKQTNLIFAVEQILTIAFDLSIILTSQLAAQWDCFEMKRLQNALSYMSPQEMLANQGVDIYHIVSMCLFIYAAINFATLTMMVVHAGNSPLLIFAAYLFRVSKVLARPIILFFVFNVMCDQLGVALRVGSGLLLLLFVTTVLLSTKLYFNPMPKNNPYYQIDNEYDFYDVIIVLVRIVLICFNTDVRKTILVVLAFEASRLYCFEHVLASPALQIISTLPSQLVVVFCVFIVINQLAVGISQPLFYFWCVAMLSLLVYKWIQLGLPDSRKLVLFSCKSHDRRRICQFIGAYWEIMKEEDTQLVCHNYCGFFYSHIESCKLGSCYIKAQKEEISAAVEQNNRAKLEQYLANFLLKLLERMSLGDQVLATQYYLCLYEAMSRKTLDSFTRRIDSLHLRFIVFHFGRILLKNVVNEDYRITDQNFIETKNMFFTQLKKTVASFSNFFRQLRQQRTRLSHLERIGGEAYILTCEIQRLFQRILQNSKMDITLTEFYLEFVENFLKDASLIKQLTVQIGKKQIQDQYEDYSLEECPFPTLQINMENSSIVDSNLEAVKLLGWQKHELLERPIKELLVIDETDDWSELFTSLMESPVLCLAKSRFEGIIVTRITTRIKEYSSKKSHLLQFVEVPKIGNIAYAIIQADLVMQVCSKTKLEKGFYTFTTEEAYTEFVQPNWPQLVKFQSIVVDCERESLCVAVEICNSVDRLTDMIRMELKQRPTLKSQSVVRKTMKQFHNSYFFSYRVEVGNRSSYSSFSEKLYLEGGRANDEDIEIKLTKQERHARDEGKPKNFAEGIKSYRLRGDRIFNVELQSEQMSKDYIKIQTKPEELNTFIRTFYDKRVLMGVIIGACFAGFCVALSGNVYENSMIASTDNYYQTYTRIETFELRFYRMACIFRDVDLDLVPGYTEDWTIQAQQILNLVQANQNDRLFTDTLHTVEFLNVSYTNDLDEIYNTVLSNMLHMVAARTTLISEDIHYLIVNQLHNFTYAEKEKIRLDIEDSIVTVHWIARSLLAIKSLLMLLFMLSILLTQYTEMRARLVLLMQFRIMSDQEVDNCIGRLHNFETMLQLNDKNIQMNIHNCLLDDSITQKRSVPKQCHTGLSERKGLIASLLMLILLGTAINVYIYSRTVIQASNNKEFLMLNRAFAESYINYLYMSIDSEHGVNERMLNQTSTALFTIEENYQTMPFSSEFNEFIRRTYFDDACPEIQHLSPGLDCENFSPTTNFRNPFKEGLDIYFHHVYYNINEDSQQTIPSTGVLARPFMLLVQKILDETEIEWIKFVAQAAKQYQWFLVLEVCQFVVMLFTYYLIQRKQISERLLVKDICRLIPVTDDQKKEGEESPKDTNTMTIELPTLELL